ncbi:MAG: hypothetical protein EZS28_018789, partial [Streblomastix strix]
DDDYAFYNFSGYDYYLNVYGYYQICVINGIQEDYDKYAFIFVGEDENYQQGVLRQEFDSDIKFILGRKEDGDISDDEDDELSHWFEVNQGENYQSLFNNQAQYYEDEDDCEVKAFDQGFNYEDEEEVDDDKDGKYEDCNNQEEDSNQGIYQISYSGLSNPGGANEKYYQSTIYGGEGIGGSLMDCFGYGGYLD